MIRVLYADTGSDSLGILFHQIGLSLERIRRDRSGAKRVILIVPAQFTLEAEEAAFRYLGGPGFFDLHIMSNNKLAQEIIRETGGMGQTPINSLGRAMVLRRIAKDHADDFGIFRKVASDASFLEMAGDFVLQLKQNNADVRQLSEAAGRLREGSLLERKLSDMQIFCSEYTRFTEGKYNDSEDLRAFVTDRVRDCSYVKDSEIFFYDFYSFTRRDIAFLTALAAGSHGLTVQLLMNETDEAYEASRRTCRQLRAAASDCGIPFAAEEAGAEFARKVHPERHVVRCASPFTQAETIAAEILTLVRERSFRCGEIAVLTGDLEGQGRILKRVLELAGIPVFLDEKRAVQHDPAAELLSALLSIAEDGLRQQSVLRLLKTGLTAFADDDLTERFENYVKKYHITGDRFEKEFKYGKSEIGEEGFASLEALRRTLCASLDPFRASFAQAVLAEEKTEILRRYMEEELGITGSLDRRAAELAESGLLEASEELPQIWDLLSGIFDQLCELMGGTPLSCSEYREIIEGSLKDIKVGLLPQAEGKVMIGTLARSRVSRAKALFIAGFNDGLIPRGEPSEGILTDFELTQLEELGYVLAKNRESFLEEDQLVIRKTVDSPSEYLWLGYPVSDSEGNGLSPSQSLLALCSEYALTEEPDIENRGESLAYIQSPASSIRYLDHALRSSAAGEALADEWKTVYNILKNNGEPRLDAIRAGLFFSNRMDALGTESASALYGFGDSPACSPSRIETFSGCPFRHFIGYGLRPDEQREFEIGAIELGTVYHEVLQRFCEQLSAPCRAARIRMSDPASPWMTVSDAEIDRMIGEAFDLVMSEALDGLLSFGKPERYRGKRIKDVCVRFAAQLVRQVRIGSVSDMLFEIPFGRGERFPAVEIPTQNGILRLEGKIDRVDLSEVSGQEYVKIIDYKSGSRSFDREAAEKGLAVQLMVYMEGALQARYGAKPAGVFYCLIKDPGRPVSLQDIDTELIASEITESFAKEHRLNGLVVGENDVIRSIDPDALTSAGGSVLPLKTDKEGNLKASLGTEIVSGAQFDELRENVLHAVRKLCERLTGGDISVDPQRHPGSGKLPCEYCEYRGICLYEG